MPTQQWDRFANMINKSDPNPEFNIIGDDFPALGGIPHQNSHQMTDEHSMSMNQNQNLLNPLLNSSTKTAITEFHEQQEAQHTQAQLNTDMLTKTLRKEAIKIPNNPHNIMLSNMSNRSNTPANQTANNPSTLSSQINSPITVQNTQENIRPSSIQQMLHHQQINSPTKQFSNFSNGHKMNAPPPGVGMNNSGFCKDVGPADKTFQKLLHEGKLCLDMKNETWHNVPPDMMQNQFGLLALMLNTRATDEDKILSHGIDLTELGLPMNRDITSIFDGPFSETPCRPQDIDYYHMPSEYLTNHRIGDKLHDINLEDYKADTLFFLYYTNPKEMIQSAAIHELYQKNWLFDKSRRAWLKTVQTDQVKEFINDHDKCPVGLEANFEYFNHNTWSIEKHRDRLLYKHIDEESYEADKKAYDETKSIVSRIHDKLNPRTPSIQPASQQHTTSTHNQHGQSNNRQVGNHVQMQHSHGNLSEIQNLNEMNMMMQMQGQNYSNQNHPYNSWKR